MCPLDALPIWTLEQGIIFCQNKINILLSQADYGPIVHDDVREESIRLLVCIISFPLTPLEARHEESTKNHHR